MIEFNEYGLPIKRGGGILSGWLGTIARKKEHCSVEWTDRRLMPKEDKQALINFTKVN
ncbi:hypothetical protein Syun_007085 [Stephania yunnanensis]|uniref:Uncharacterized protein n=1 Tax=Stephania yunnanensis TaxID=152371 RepID=A0AAP0KZL6_9MAGN